FSRDWSSDVCSSDLMPTFATYDLRAPNNDGSGNAIAVPVSGSGANGIVTPSKAVSNTNPATWKPGDFGPLERPATNMQALDWDRSDEPRAGKAGRSR